MNTPDVVSLKPTPEQYASAFGGSAPLVTVQPGTIVALSAEDCFAGKVRGLDDLPSQACTFPFRNPVTGPVVVEGAEPGDTSPCTSWTSCRSGTGKGAAMAHSSR